MVLQGSLVNLTSSGIFTSLRSAENNVRTSFERLGTGLRINSAKDDPGGLLVSNRLASQFRGLEQVSTNAQRGINIAEVATQAVTEVNDLLQEIRTAVLAAQNPSSTTNARLANQREIQEKLDEINTVASETRFQNKNLLDGTFASSSTFRTGQGNFGGKISFGAGSTNLSSGSNSLNIALVQEGTETLKAGDDLSFNTGIRFATDIAVSIGQLARGSNAAGTSDLLTSTTFNQVSLQSGGAIRFNGTLANGINKFAGTFEIENDSDVNDLISSIQSAIDIAEAAQGINGTGNNETNVSLNTVTGRVEFGNSNAGDISQFNINFLIDDSSGVQQTSFGSTRDQNINNQFIDASTTGARVGNSISAITGSTFASGEYEIAISDVVQAQNRVVESSLGFFNSISLITPVTSATNLSDGFINGVSLANGDVLTFGGSDPDGTTFSVAFTVSDSATSEEFRDGRVATFGDLVNGLNNRDRSDVGFGFNGATATLTASGTIQLEDDLAATSSTNFNFFVTNIRTIDDGQGGFIIEFENSETFEASATTEGNKASASISIAGGPVQTVNPGDVVTLQGGNAVEENEPTPSLTLRVGNDLEEGSDKFVVTENIYEGRLGDGPAVQFRNGQQNVIFTENPSNGSGAFQQVKIDFDDVLNVTNTIAQGAQRFELSSTNRELNFQLGEENERGLVIPDLRPNNLGLSEEQNLTTIDVTTASGAEEALDIVDRAIEQTNDVLSRLGSFTNRLQSTSEHLDFTSFILENTFNQITSANVAEETTNLALNSIFLEARTSLLIQANTLQQNVFEILYGLE